MSILNPKASLEKGDLFAIVKMFHKGTKESYSFQKDISLKTLSRKEIFDGLSKMGLTKEDLDDIANIANPGDDFDQLNTVNMVQLANSAIALKINVDEVNDRVRELDSYLQTSKYSNQKQKLKNELIETC